MHAEDSVDRYIKIDQSKSLMLEKDTSQYVPPKSSLSFPHAQNCICLYAICFENCISSCSNVFRPRLTLHSIMTIDDMLMRRLG